MISKINASIRRSKDTGIFHNSREDVRSLAAMLNKIIKKVNDIIDVVNEASESAAVKEESPVNSR